MNLHRTARHKSKTPAYAINFIQFTSAMASKTTATSLEEHFRNVADVKELLRLAGLPMRATAVDAMLQMAAEGVSAEGIIAALNRLKEKKIAETLAMQ